MSPVARIKVKLRMRIIAILPYAPDLAHGHWCVPRRAISPSARADCAGSLRPLEPLEFCRLREITRVLRRVRAYAGMPAVRGRGAAREIASRCGLPANGMKPPQDATRLQHLFGGLQTMLELTKLVVDSNSQRLK